MNGRKLALLVPILAVVFISGCIGGTDTSGTKGVVITGFAPDVASVYSGDEVVLTATVENIGGENANDVKLKLFGLGNDWQIIDEKIQTIGFLEKRQASEGIPGGFGDAYWSVQSPSNLKVDNVYTAAVRLTYSYKTTALANIKVYNSEYLKSIPEEADAIMKSPGIGGFTVTDAPITIELSGISKPIISKGAVKASVTVLISNIGDGKPFKTDENDMTVTVSKIKVGNNAPCVANEAVRLPRNGKKSVTCTFLLGDVDSYTTIPMEVELTYRYFVDSSTQIAVSKALFVDDSDSGYQPPSGVDKTAPVISPVTTGSDYLTYISSNSAYIQWKTNENSNTVVKYGRSCTSSMTSKSSSTLTKTHAITLENLQSGIKYYFIIESTDASGNTGRYPSSGCKSFITLSATTTRECYVHSDCCINVEKSTSGLVGAGPCGLDQGAYCDSDGKCHCGSAYTTYDTCPPFDVPED